MLLLTLFVGVIGAVVFIYLSGGILKLHKKLGGEVKKDMKNYSKLYDEEGERDVEKRKSSYGDIVPNFYRLVTDFYEYGWGESFHFAPSRKGEAFDASLSRHEHYLAYQTGIKEGMTVLDLGAGIGGPLREIARFTGAKCIGINIVDYQIERGNELNKYHNIENLCSFQKGDFHSLPFPDESVDAVYSIEAICHTTNKEKVYSEVFRVLKKGGRFGFYDWVMTNKFNESNPRHVSIKEGIEIGNALPDIMHQKVVRPQLENVGFKVLHEEDAAVTTPVFNVPWYNPLGKTFNFTLRGVANSYYSRIITNKAVWLLEKIGLATEGSYYTAMLLHKTALDLVASGETEIFTPSYLVVSEKPQ